MKSIVDYTAQLIIAGCLVAIGIQGASIEDRFLPHFITSDNTPTVTAASASSLTSSAVASGATVNDSPIVVSQGSPGKKIQITITKEITGHLGHGHGAAGPHAGTAATHPPPHSHNSTHATAAAQPAHAGHEGPAPAKLNLNGTPLVVDNETVADLLQQMLAGNLQNVQKNGRPLALPPGGKPVAVIFSSSMHVVDLGDLQPPTTTPLPTTTSPVTSNIHTPHNASAHPSHNSTHHAHPGLNHTTLLESLISPLMALTHLGAAHGNEQPPVQQPIATISQVPQVQAQSMQMQPVIMMVPVSQMQGLQAVPASSLASAASAPRDSLAPLGGVLQSILAAKQQLLNSTLLANHGSHPGHEAHVLGTPSVVSPAPPMPTATVSVQPSAAAPPPPVVVPQQPTKVKKVNISMSKTKII